MPAFTPEGQARFDAELERVLARYPPDRAAAAMIPALRLCQEINGFISPEAMELVSARLQVPVARALEVATFYTLLHTQKPGSVLVDLCTNVSCALRGAERLLGHLERRLGVRAGHTTTDGRFTLREAECLASCGTAPAMRVNERFEENLTESKLDQILDAMARKVA